MMQSGSWVPANGIFWLLLITFAKCLGPKRLAWSVSKLFYCFDGIPERIFWKKLILKKNKQKKQHDQKQQQKKTSKLTHVAKS